MIKKLHYFLYVFMLGCGGYVTPTAHWHISNHPQSNTNWSSTNQFHNSVSQQSAFSSFNSYIQEQECINYWNMLAQQLQICNRAEACTYAFEQLPVTIEKVHTLLHVATNACTRSLIHHIETFITLATFDCHNSALQELLNNSLAELKEIILDKQGYFKSDLSKKELQKIESIVKKFYKRANEWRKTLPAAISCAQEVLKNSNDSNRYLIPACFANTEVQQLITMAQLCRQGTMEHAYEIVQKNSVRFDATGTYNYYKKLYESYFYQEYTKEGIKKRYCSDPYYKRLTLEPTLVPCTENAVLEKRAQLYNTYMHISTMRDLPPALHEMVYTLVDAHSASPGTDPLNGKVLHFIAQHKNAWQHTSAPCHAMLATLCQKYKAMIAGDSTALEYLKAALLPEVSQRFLVTDIATEYASATHLSDQSQVYHTVAHTCRSLTVEPSISTKTYSLSWRSAYYLQQKGMPLEAYSYFTGNEIQHALHELTLKNLELESQIAIHHLHAPLNCLFDLGIQANVVARNDITSYRYQRAFTVSTGVNALFTQLKTVGAYYGWEIGAGIKDGLLQSVVGICHAIRHPIQTGKGILMLGGKLGLNGIKFFLLADRMENYPFLPQEEKEKLDQEYHDLMDPLVTTVKNASVRDWSREITSFVVGPKLLNKVTSFTKPLFSAVVQKAKNFMPTIAKAEEIAVTAEGIALNNSSPMVQNATMLEAVENNIIGNKSALNTTSENLATAGQSIENFSLNSDIIAQATEKFSKTPGALGKNGPLKQVLVAEKLENPAINIKGPIYELEKGLQLEAQGEKVLEFGAKVNLLKENTNLVIKKLDIDIATSTRFIECKNWNWEKLSVKMLDDLKSKVGELSVVAKQNGKVFEFFSKNAIPQFLKDWFEKRGISYYEG